MPAVHSSTVITSANIIAMTTPTLQKNIITATLVAVYKSLIIPLTISSFLTIAFATPVFTVQPNPRSNSVSVGASLTNKVSVTTTNLPLTYQWQLNQTDLPGFTNRVLVLTNLQSSQSGDYSVIVTDADGPARSESWNVSVNPLFTKVLNDPMATVLGRVTSISVADVNHDNWPDLFLSVVYGSNLLLTNNGHGMFTRVNPNPVASGSQASASAAWGDYDNDGRPDIFVSVNGQANDLLYHHDGKNLVKIGAGSIVNSGGNGNGCAWADYDNDGFLDLYVCNSDQNNFLYHNNGDGTFKRIMTNSIVLNTGNSQGCAWADYDNDGYPDLFVAKGGVNNALYHNDKKGNFTLMASAPMSKEAGGGGLWFDYNNDGLLDLLVVNYNAKSFLYANKGDGTFAKITTNALVSDVLSGTGAAAADYDNDGYPDIFMTQFGGPNILFHNNGDGTFTKVPAGSASTDGGECTSPVWVDANNDGFPDLLLPNYRGNAGYFYLNNGNSNHWITVVCDGRVSNRSAIGTKVRVKATIGGKTFWQTREVGFQSDLRTGFGLGDAADVEVLRVEWPSGVVQDFNHVKTGQVFKVPEPSKLSTQRKETTGEIVLGLKGGKGSTYTVETSIDFKQWDFLIGITNFNASQIWTGTPEAGKTSQQYFRVMEQP